jgi:ABC-type transporter lipoprotein component MlaA/pimeloyl-ACP methyl ester carboxylesterase
MNFLPSAVPPLTDFATRAAKCAFHISALVLFAGCSTAPPAKKQQAITSPEFIADPLEPVNRGMWAVNHGILVGVMQPTGRVYRTVVPTRARESIHDFTRNITYPGRVVNHMLQGRWSGAGNESLRFLTNTTVGVAGFLDVASKWNIPKSEADFGQTFVRWGWKPSTYVMLPGLGPSDETHAFGTLADEAAEPWNYARPYVYASYGSGYNRLTDQTEKAVQFIHTESDPYVGVKDLWTYVSKEVQPDWSASAPKDPPSLQTIGVALIAPEDPKFLQHGREMSVRLPSTGRKIKFNCWLRKSNAPLVYITPGLGLHRISNTTLALAEMIYQDGYSVVTTTGIFHPEFMRNASTSELPAYPPNDCNDLLVELTEIDKLLEGKNPGMFGKRALVGFSMGGFQSLYLAAREDKAAPELMRFDRYVAINTPVDLRHGVKTLDEYYNAPKAWPAEQRQEKVNNAVHKAAALASLPPSAVGDIPLDGIESKFLIGLSFKLTLRDTVFDSQLRHNRGIIQAPLSEWRRAPAYEEIMNLNFRDYFLRFAVPYYKERGIGLDEFAREINLRTYRSKLRSNPRIRVLVNSNDFILNSSDVSWLRSTVGPSRLTVFPNGGHLGNLTSPPLRTAIAASLDGLK